MKPGATTRPVASIVARPSSGAAETAWILPAEMPRWRTASRPLSGSMTRPLRMTRSYAAERDATPFHRARQFSRQDIAAIDAADLAFVLLDGEVVPRRS